MSTSSSSSRAAPRMLLAGLLLLAVASYLGWRAVRNAAPPPPDMVAVLARNDRGVAFQEQFEFADAAAEFQAVVEMAPDWQPGHVNYGIALLNQASPESIERAIQQFQLVLSREPDNPHAHFCLGVILMYHRHFPDAIPHFEAVTRVDPNDAGAWYQLGYVLDQNGDSPERVKDCFQRAHRLNPYLRGALYNLFRRLDERQAKAMQEEMEKLIAAEAADATSIKYTEQASPYAQVIGRPIAPAPTLAFAPLPLFQSAKLTVNLAAGTRWATAADFGAGPIGDLRRAVRKRFGATIVRLDFNRDGRPDLFLLGAVVEGGQVRDLLLRNDGDGTFTDVTTAAGLGGARVSLGCCVGDFDNDGLPDLFVTGAGEQKLFRNKGDGTFEDVTAKAGLGKLNAICLGCAWADLDQDGDLDLLIARFADTPEQALAQLSGDNPTANGGIAVFLNVGEAPPATGPLPGLDVKFRRAPELEKQLASPGGAIGFVLTDADGDRDLDVIVLEEGARPGLLLNDRLLRFRRVDIAAVEAGGAWNGALVLDVDHDERSDLFLIAAGHPPRLLMNRAVPGLDPTKIFEKGPVHSPPLKQAVAVDVDLDGWMDVIGLAQDGKPVLLHNDRAGKLVDIPEALGSDRDWPADLVAVAAGDFDGDCKPDLLVWSEFAGLQLHRSTGNGNRGVKLALSGRREKGTFLRTTNDAIGARVTVQSGRHWTALENTTFSAGLGQSNAPLEIGLGQASAAEAIVRVRWPDFVVQAEFLAANTEFMSIEKADVRQVRETNRKGSSCPVLFTWDGEKFVFVTDCLGAGSVGEMQPDGTTRPPRAEESIKIEPHQLATKDGQFILKIAEPMDEVMYLDSARLIAIDLPPGADAYPDERFPLDGPPPTQELLVFRDRIFPRKATDQSGRDVTAILRERDGRYVDGFALRSWIGYAEEHWVELDFGDQLRNIGPKMVLVLAGWTEYAYPETIFGAAQAGVPMQAPMLEKLGAGGKWQPVCEVGFPAGLPRVMTKDVTGLLTASVGRLRIRTNMQVYWDQIFLAPAADIERHVTALGVAAATLAAPGYMHERSAGPRQPVGYDYDHLDAVAVSRWRGRLTKLGDVTELLAAIDDRVVVCGPGDEVTLRFDACALPPLPAGWTRRFVLRTNGWCKDAAPFTAMGAEVTPLPFRGMKQYPPMAGELYPHPADLHKWHTRRAN